MDANAINEQAAAWFLKRGQRALTPEEESQLHAWLAENPEHAAAWRETAQTWQAFDDHGLMPELVVAREQALAGVRRVQSRRWEKSVRHAPRWAAAAAVLVALISGVAYWWAGIQAPGNLSTGIGEQRTVLLADNSRVALDASTRIRVDYSTQARIIELLNGQAQFDVATDAARPFRVRAGDRVIEALGTSFTVDYSDQRVQVALLEGRVRVGTTELKPGELLSIDAKGHQAREPKADLAMATAWRQGKVIFQAEPLNAAVNRLNRYSRVRLEVADPAIAQWPVSGVFDAADAAAFAEAVETYFPIETHRTRPDVIELRPRR